MPAATRVGRSPSPAACTASAAPALSRTASRTGPGSPSRRRRTTPALCAASPPRRSSVVAGGRPRSPGSSVDLLDAPRADRPERGRRGRRQLVEAVVAAEHPGVDPAGREDTRHHRSHPRVGAADRLGGRPARVGERPEEVERRPDAQLATGYGGVAHRRVERRREAEGDPGLDGDLGDPGRRQVEPDAEGLQHIGRPGHRGRRAVAVLDHGHAGAGRHDRRHRRDVDRHRPVHAGADHVEQAAGHADRVGRGEHGVREARHLLDRLALARAALRRSRRSAPGWRCRTAPRPSPTTSGRRRGPGERRDRPGLRARWSSVGSSRRNGRGVRWSPARASAAAPPRPRPAGSGRAGAAPPRRPATRSRARRPAGGRSAPGSAGTGRSRP